MKKSLTRKFKPGLPMTCFVIFFLPILLYLSYWQVTRAIEKKEIWETYSVNKTLPPLSEQELLVAGLKDNSYRSVMIRGYFIDQSFFLDNRIYRSEKGYEVFTPFKSESKKIYLINRGWTNNIDQGFFSTPTGTQRIEGIVSPFRKYGLSLKGASFKGPFPITVQELTFDLASDLLGEATKIEEIVIQLSPASRGSYEPIWGPTELKAPRHWGYASQWLGLAIVLVFLYIYFGYKQTNANEKREESKI
tara:strand:+ start:1148 stop:1891 length:744 start_codon:yes stop_codon:yes gene_type:complete